MTWSTGSRQDARALRSFTLLELLVVIIIISSLLAVSVPRFRGTFANVRFDNFCQDLLSRMRYLQERSRLEQQAYRIVFDSASQFIAVQVMPKSKSDFSSVPGLLGKNIPIPQGMSVTTEKPTIIFNPDGTIMGKDIYIEDDYKKVFIRIINELGRLKLDDINKE